MTSNRMRDALNAGLRALAAAAIIVFVLNACAEFYFKRHPALLMAPAERENPFNRLFRETLVPRDKAAQYFDLKSADEVRDMFGERLGHGQRYEPYTQWLMAPFIGKYHGVTEAGYRLSREGGPWPPDPANFNVYFFGNSTGFGVSPYWATVASYMQDAINAARRLDRHAFVYNFARPGYITAQEQILFSRLLKEEPAPNMAVFMDGAADFCYFDGNPSNWQSVASYYNANAEDRQAADVSYGIVTHWEKLIEFARTLPLARALNALRSRLSGADTPPTADTYEPATETELRQSVNRYYAFVRQTRAVARAYGVQPIFVWQPTPLYKYDPKYDLFSSRRSGCQINNVTGYPIMAETLQREPLGDDFIWAADMQETLHEPLYVDWFHYNAPMSRRLAHFILDAVTERGLLYAASTAEHGPSHN